MPYVVEISCNPWFRLDQCTLEKKFFSLNYYCIHHRYTWNDRTGQLTGNGHADLK